MRSPSELASKETGVQVTAEMVQATTHTRLELEAGKIVRLRLRIQRLKLRHVKLLGKYQETRRRSGWTSDSSDEEHEESDSSSSDLCSEDDESIEEQEEVESEEYGSDGEI